MSPQLQLLQKAATTSVTADKEFAGGPTGSNHVLRHLMPGTCVWGPEQNPWQQRRRLWRSFAAAAAAAVAGPDPEVSCPPQHVQGSSMKGAPIFHYVLRHNLLE